MSRPRSGPRCSGGEAKNIDSQDLGQWRDVVVDGESVLGVQHAPDLVPPRWPSTGVADQQQQLHYDLYVDRDDVEAASREVVELGARSVQPAEDPDAVHGFHVFADPAGHPFCICWSSSAG